MGFYFAQSSATVAAQYSIRILLGSMLVIALVVLVASLSHNRFHATKKIFYTLLGVAIIATTTALVVTNITLMATSETSSIQKRNAYISIYVCDQKIPIISQQLLSSTAGNGRQNVHKDGRLEFLGYLVNPDRDISLGSFMRSMRGSISANTLTIAYPPETETRVNNPSALEQFVRVNPLGERYLELFSGSACNTFPSMLSVYVYSFDPSTGYFIQKRLVQPETYQIKKTAKGESDCIVVVFGEPNGSTNLRCGDYPSADRVIFNPMGDVEQL